MTKLPHFVLDDPTLFEADKALAARENAKPRRGYLGMSAIGDPCARKLWYEVYDPLQDEFDAATLKRFADGHRSEDLMAERIRLVKGIEMHTVDPQTGRQFAHSDFNGRFKGHMDGVVLGLIQSPATWHVWEGKCVNDAKFAKLKKLKAERGEKQTLKEWDEVYYAQAQCYMGYADLTRHWLTVCTPGGRDWDAVRTEFNKEDFEALKDKAKRIFEARAPLARVSNDPNWFLCKWCKYQVKCHGA